jgi:hypothetical protein
MVVQLLRLLNDAARNGRKSNESSGAILYERQRAFQPAAAGRRLQRLREIVTDKS